MGKRQYGGAIDIIETCWALGPVAIPAYLAKYIIQKNKEKKVRNKNMSHNRK